LEYIIKTRCLFSLVLYIRNITIHLYFNYFLKKNMIIFLSVIYVFFLWIVLFAFLLPKYYFSELVLSFLPYIILISFLWVIISFLSFKIFSKKNIIKFWKKMRFFLAFLFLLSWFVFFFYSKKFNYFYNVNINQIQDNMTWWLKILYANVYKNNKDYTWLMQFIEEKNPDLIMFVEFADHHYENLKNFLNDNYPYSNSMHWSKTYVWNMVFSKQKIENWADDFPQWAWRYWYFSVNYEDKPIYFYLVHMSSPISKKFFDMRNKQIDYFFEDFSIHQKFHRIKNDKVVAIGDFNTSPWSIFYRNFAKWFEWEYINITRSLPIVFTRKSFIAPFLWSHIDHIFINKFVKITDFSVVSIPDSDHRWFLFNIK